MSSTSTVYCVDASACALLSEDYPATTRWHLQRELVACHSQACLGGSPGDSPAASSQRRQVVLVAGSGGRASVALHPTADVTALQQALDGVQPAGEGNLVAALKLALLVSRRFHPGSTRVTAFVASAGGADSLAADRRAAQELRQSYLGAGLALDIAVLCPREELGEAAARALEALAGNGSTSSDSSSSSSSSTSREAACSRGADSALSCSAARGCDADSGSTRSSTSLRLVWLQPVATAAESWQQLEAALELLEGGREAGGGTSAGSTRLGPAAGGAAARSALPAQISRAPRQLDPLSRPRTALLAPRSGLQQPALCRGESLSRLGHLSSDGMMRPWLPTYSSIGKQAAAAARGTASSVRGAAGSTGSDFCFVEVQPVPRWRTLLKVAAGRMLAAPPEAAAASSRGSGNSSAEGSPAGSDDYATASSRLLRSLQALSVMDEAEQDSASSASSSEDGEAACPPVPVRYSPDPRRGTLRLLQGTKEPHLLRLVWRAEPEYSAAGGRSDEQPAGAPPLDMFGRAAASTGGGAAGAPSSRHAELLSYMPASAVAASAARGPLLREGCELWEAAAEFEWELPLPTAERDDEADSSRLATADGGGDGGAADGELPAAVEARQLPNGAQLLLVTPSRSAGSAKVLRRGRRRHLPATAAFWLQQRLSPDSLQLPVYGTASSSLPAAAAAPAQPAIDPSVAAEGSTEGRAGERERQQHPQSLAGEPTQPQVAPAQQPEQQGGGEASLLMAALLGMLRQPPRVDLRRLRRDVKSGAIQVTPITVGPLPAQFVRDIVSARSAMLGGLGVENLDSWEGEGEPRKGGSEQSTSSGGPASGRSAAGGSVGSPQADGGQDAAGAASGSESSSKEGSRLTEAALQKHRAAAYSLLRQRLARQPASGNGPAVAGDCTGAGAVCCSGEQAAVTADGAAAAADSNRLPAATVPCSGPQPTPAAPLHLSDSCSSSAAGTPFGTPLHFFPGRLVHQQSPCSYAQAGAAGDGEVAAGMQAGEAEAVATAAQVVPGLPGAAAGCLKRESSSVLASASSQADGAADALDPMFPLE